MLDLPAGFVLAEIGRRTADVAYWAMNRRVPWGRDTGRNVSTQPDCRMLYSAAPGPVADILS